MEAALIAIDQLPLLPIRASANNTLDRDKISSTSRATNLPPSRWGCLGVSGQMGAPFDGRVPASWGCPEGGGCVDFEGVPTICYRGEGSKHIDELAASARGYGMEDFYLRSSTQRAPVADRLGDHRCRHLADDVSLQIRTHGSSGG